MKVLGYIRFCYVAAMILAAAFAVSGQGVKRVVIIKIDGLPAYYVDKFVKEKDPATGRSVLPWFEEVFYRNGTRVPNYYTRGMSLSGPSWGQVDTGQRLQLKGNVEFDRYTLQAYDYLNFIPYYIDYGLKKKADMPAVEVMDQLGIPILADAFNYENRYTSQQLYQRGNNWEVLASGFINFYPGNARDFIDEWTLGLDFRNVTIGQAERDIIGKLVKRDHIDYFDYYDVSFDHASHHNNDKTTRLAALKGVDKVIGNIWVAIQQSTRAAETALIVVSDHGVNSDESVYSQGFNLVKMLGSKAGGGHHVVTKRRLMLDYSLKGIYPLVPLIKSNSDESFYLRGQSSDYPTALLDFDGNERSSLHLRNSDLNVLHILLQQLKGKLSGELKAAVTDALFGLIDVNRARWTRDLREIEAEIDSLKREADSEKKLVDQLPKKFGPEDIERGLDKAAVRKLALNQLDHKTVDQYQKYCSTLRNLLGLKMQNFDPRKVEIKDLIALGAMGDPNSVYQLQNYVIGIGAEGLVLSADKKLDLERSFSRVNYFELLHSQRVRNNVQIGVSNRPIDFVAIKIPLESFAAEFSSSDRPTEDPIWVYGGEEKQILILARDDGGKTERHYKYLPVAGLRQDKDGRSTFRSQELGVGLPLKYFEDEHLAIPTSQRAAWLSAWHSEVEWLNAVHKTRYSNALIGLNEQLTSHPVFTDDGTQIGADAKLVRAFRQRQRHLTEADLLILASDHWNFDVRGFNPGGNHGSFFRVSTNSTLMFAGGRGTGIPRGLAVEQPYDSLSFIPTVLRLMGRIDQRNEPDKELKDRGFRRFPGRVIKEIIETRP
jgi:Type I phosphodiesterase / nucleotide pyrophosphatase